MPVDGDQERIFATEVTPTHRRRGLAGLSRAVYLRSATWERTELQTQGAERRCTREVARQAGLHTRIAFVLLFLAMSGVATAQPTSSSQPSSAVPADYASQILNPEWRAAFPYRAAFGSLCSLGPLACALIDGPFALNARLEFMIRPKAPDGSTGVLLPFAVSVPLFSRAEVGLGSCYAGFWATKEEAGRANIDASARRPSGLCPFFLAGKLLLFPWFRDPHRNPALAIEYLFEYQAGPFHGPNQLGLPGPLSKISLAYRHPMGRLELSGAASLLIDHLSRAGTLQLGGHVGYRLPVGEHFWIFGQIMAQAPSWGPLIAEGMGRQMLSLAPPLAGTWAVGIQQRADFGFGAGLTVLLTKSELETRVDLLFRLLSFEIGPHIKPLIPAREKKDEPEKVAVSVKSQPGPQLVCPPGYMLAPQSAAGRASPPSSEAASPGSGEPTCVATPPPHRIPSSRWGEPCYLAPLDGSPLLRMGNIDSTGQYCEWDGLRLPLGAVIDPPQRVPHSELERPKSAAPTSQPPPLHATTASAEAALPGVPLPRGHARRKSPAPMAADAPQPTQTLSKPAPLHAPRQDRFERVTEEAPSVPGSAFASGFVDGAKDSYIHARDLYRAIKQHGPGMVIPSREAAEAWLHEVKEKCLDHLDGCVRETAEEAAQVLNDFRRKPWADKQYTFGRWGWGAFEMTVEGVAAGALPGARVLVRAGEEVAERTLAKGAVKAAVKKAGKEVSEEVAEHGGEAATRKAAKEAAEHEAKHAADVAASAPSLDDLSKAANVPDRKGLTEAGRALQKHSSRPGSTFPRTQGNVAQSNQAGQHVVDDILTSPGAMTTRRHHARFGEVIEIRAPNGKGVRYDANGNFLGLLEP